MRRVPRRHAAWRAVHGARMRPSVPSRLRLALAAPLSHVPPVQGARAGGGASGRAPGQERKPEPQRGRGAAADGCGECHHGLSGSVDAASCRPFRINPRCRVGRAAPAPAPAPAPTILGRLRRSRGTVKRRDEHHLLWGEGKPTTSTAERCDEHRASGREGKPTTSHPHLTRPSRWCARHRRSPHLIAIDDH